jgi:hypothetical protein
VVTRRSASAGDAGEQTTAIEFGAGDPGVVAAVEMHGGLAGRQGEIAQHVQRGRQQTGVMPIRRGSQRRQRNPCAINGNRALGSLLGAVHRTGASDLAAARRLGDAAGHADVLELQPDEPIVNLAGDVLELIHQPQRDPLVAAPAQRGSEQVLSAMRR